MEGTDTHYGFVTLEFKYDLMRNKYFITTSIFAFKGEYNMMRFFFCCVYYLHVCGQNKGTDQHSAVIAQLISAFIFRIYEPNSDKRGLMALKVTFETFKKMKDKGVENDS